MDIGEIARAIRGHRGMEIGLHWTLDMTFREDESRTRGENIRANFAWLNRLALSLPKQHPEKTSIHLKCQACGWDLDFLKQVLTGIARLLQLVLPPYADRRRRVVPRRNR